METQKRRLELNQGSPNHPARPCLRRGGGGSSTAVCVGRIWGRLEPSGSKKIEKTPSGRPVTTGTLCPATAAGRLVVVGPAGLAAHAGRHTISVGS